MLSSPWGVMLRINISRFIRKSYRSIRRKLYKDNAGTPSSIFGETILPPEKANKERKYKSTLAVSVAGTAIGVSQLAAISHKYGNKLAPKTTLYLGLCVGLTAASVWYKYIHAAYDGVTEDDIAMMFELANSTGYGSIDSDSDSIKAVDILHTIVTGKTDATEDKASIFEYEEDKSDKEDNTDSDVFGKSVSFSDKEETKPSIGISKPNTFGKGTVGKPLFRAAEKHRKSFLPDLDRQDESKNIEVADGWMDFT